MQNRIAMLGLSCVIALLFFAPVSKPEIRNISEPCGVVLLCAMPPRKVAWEDGHKESLQQACCFILTHKAGFTLIEMSIVLIIIGLIVGGILVGQDLIQGATVRAQISQIQKYQAAVHTFQTKYNNYLPGDMPDPDATQFGFQSRGIYPGEGDGNGVIEGVYQDAANSNWGGFESAGETVVFWVDLSAAGLIDGTFNTGTETNRSTIASANLGKYFPTAKIGQGNYIYVFSGGPGISSPGTNYYSLSAVTSVPYGSGPYSNLALSVQQANAIDGKLDDGLPQSGNIMAVYLNYSNSMWVGAASGAVANGSSSTCYDNGGNASNPMRYSLGQNSGTGLNCALSFQFQ